MNKNLKENHRSMPKMKNDKNEQSEYDSLFNIINECLNVYFTDNKHPYQYPLSYH